MPLHDLVGIWNAFNQAFLAFTQGEEKDQQFKKELAEACAYLRAMCVYIGVSDDLLYHIDRLVRWITATDISRESLFMLSVNMLESVTHMLSRPQFKVIPADKLPYFETPRREFGEDIIARFNAIGSDVEEAGRCYAAGRDTASVFHLMRIMEVGLRTLGKSLNDPRLEPKRNPSWDAILKKCDEELLKAAKDRSPEWRQDDVFFSTATANLRAVKDAWRNPTMHVEQDYNEQSASEIWFVVRTFMRHLATK